MGENTFVNRRFYEQLKKRAVYAILLVVILALPTIWYAGVYYGRAQAGSTPVFEHPAADYSYLIWTDGSTYYAKNGETGGIDYSGIEAGAVIQSVMDNLLTPGNRYGGLIHFGSGDFIVDTEISYNNTQGTIIWQGEGNTIYTSHNNIVGTKIQFRDVPSKYGLHSLRTGWASVDDFIIRDMTLHFNRAFWNATFTRIQLEDVDIQVSSNVDYGIYQGGAGADQAPVVWRDVHIDSGADIGAVWVHYDSMTIISLHMMLTNEAGQDTWGLAGAQSYTLNLINPAFGQWGSLAGNVTYLLAKNVVNIFGGRIGAGLATGNVYTFAFDYGGGGGGNELAVMLFGTRIYADRVVKPGASEQIYIQGFRTPTLLYPYLGRSPIWSLSYAGANVSVPASASSISIDLGDHPTNRTDYGIVVTPNWDTTVYVENKTTTGFDIGFGTVAPANAYIDWHMFEEGWTRDD